MQGAALPCCVTSCITARRCAVVHCYAVLCSYTFPASCQSPMRVACRHWQARWWGLTSICQRHPYPGHTEPNPFWARSANLYGIIFGPKLTSFTVLFGPVTFFSLAIAQCHRATHMSVSLLHTTLHCYQHSFGPICAVCTVTVLASPHQQRSLQHIAQRYVMLPHKSIASCNCHS